MAIVLASDWTWIHVKGTPILDPYGHIARVLTELQSPARLFGIVGCLAIMDSRIISSSPPRAPALLPAFEPLSSSPGGQLPRLSKRKYEDHARDDVVYYPTPVPTSSIGIIPSSPRPGLQRTVSALSERAPLGSVPSLEVPANGEPILLGRSSNSSDYQLSANRLISRIHVRATYSLPAEEHPDGEIIVECLGWNGCMVHCLGQVVDLAKGESFVSDNAAAHLMVDVQDTRVMLTWPLPAEESGQASDAPKSPVEHPAKRRLIDPDVLASSPPALSSKMRSPKSLSPRQPLLTTTFDSTFIASQGSIEDEAVRVYEDSDSADDLPREATPTPRGRITQDAGSRAVSIDAGISLSSSSLSEPDELSEHDEENDPIVHSFGPYGENLLEKFSSFDPSGSPHALTETAKSSSNTLRIKLVHAASASPRLFRESPVKNHIINQLAFSRVHSLPLSTIFSNLPGDLKCAAIKEDKPSDEASAQVSMTAAELKTLVTNVPCIGHINREGKDAAGKPLEDEYYYLPDLDEDQTRKTLVSVGKPPMRSVRKQHKVSPRFGAYETL